MSRVANKKILKVDGIKVKINDRYIEVVGPKGIVEVHKCDGVDVREEGDYYCVMGGKGTEAFCGTMVRNLQNAVMGVRELYEKGIDLVGVGYKVVKVNEGLEFYMGFSHVVKIQDVKGVQYDVKSPTKLVVSSVDKKLLGDVVKYIVRKTREPEPYKGKGVIIKGEYVCRKEGKKKK